MTEPNSKVGLQKVLIKDLNIEQMSIMVVGIIIGKQKPKVVMGKNDQQRAVWNFTIRDSPAYYINVAYWGSAEQIFQANDKFKTGDVVEIFNPQILLRKLEERAEQYVPMVTSPYRLSLTDYSTMIAHPDNQDYLGLLRYPTKPTAAFYPLQGIHNSGRELSAKGFFVDILVAVRGLGAIRTVTTKYNETCQVREIEVFDHTSPSLKVTLWEPDLINSGRCKMTMKGTNCENPQCPVVFEHEQMEPEITFDMKVTITDHTGTLTNCRLSGQAATTALNCSAKEFMAMSDDQKNALKWRYLLQRCKIRVGIVFATSQYPVVLVLSMEHSDPIEVASKLPV